MLKDITGIKLAGGGFRNPVELRLFNPLNGNKVKLPKGTILYGRNGSDKSTIAKAIKKVVKGNIYYRKIFIFKSTTKCWNIDIST